MKIKIKRHEYDITEKDRFMDNGACIQLLTQSKERGEWGSVPTPVLSKKLSKEILKKDLIYYDSEDEYNFGVKIFGIKT